MRSITSVVARASLAILIVASVSTGTAWADTVPSGASVRVGRSIDIAAFAHAVASRYDVVFHRVVTADIDRDGDLDVLATTDAGFVIWVNDGNGRLTSEPPRPHAPMVDGRAAGDTWRDRGDRADDTIQNELPSPPLPGERAHAPPIAIASASVPAADFRFADALLGGAVPRAPPVR